MTNCVSEDKLSLRHSHFYQITLSGILSVFEKVDILKSILGRVGHASKSQKPRFCHEDSEFIVNS